MKRTRKKGSRGSYFGVCAGELLPVVPDIDVGVFSGEYPMGRGEAGRPWGRGRRSAPATLMFNPLLAATFEARPILRCGPSDPFVVAG